MRRQITLALALGMLATLPLPAQNGPAISSAAPAFDALATQSAAANPLAQPTLAPGVLLLMELEGPFRESCRRGRRQGLRKLVCRRCRHPQQWQPAVLGHAAIAAQAQWDPKTYQLTWTPQGAQMGPSNDMGFTWGHYEGHSKDKNGQPVVISGRYFTVWKKDARRRRGRSRWTPAPTSLPQPGSAALCQNLSQLRYTKSRSAQNLCTSPTIEKRQMNALLVKDEALRIEALNQYEVLNSAPDPVLDDITRLAAQICNAPVAAISLIGADRIWIKSRFGIDAHELALGSLPCETTILGDTVYEISDARNDPDYAPDGILVEGRAYRFYAGAPLTTPGGVSIGALFVLDQPSRMLYAGAVVGAQHSRPPGDHAA